MMYKKKEHGWVGCMVCAIFLVGLMLCRSMLADESSIDDPFESSLKANGSLSPRDRYTKACINAVVSCKTLSLTTLRRIMLTSELEDNIKDVASVMILRGMMAIGLAKQGRNDAYPLLLEFYWGGIENAKQKEAETLMREVMSKFLYKPSDRWTISFEVLRSESDGIVVARGSVDTVSGGDIGTNGVRRLSTEGHDITLSFRKTSMDGLVLWLPIEEISEGAR